MIIDAHCHLIADGWCPNSVILGICAVMKDVVARSTGASLGAAELAASFVPLLLDPTGERLLATMDAAGVERTCIFTVDYGLAAREDATVPIEEQNRLIAEVVRRFPDRLTAFFAVDPRRPNGLQMFQRAVEDWHMHGLKLYPPTGFSPTTRSAIPTTRNAWNTGFQSCSTPAVCRRRSSPAWAGLCTWMTWLPTSPVYPSSWLT